ncbi:pentatricopeptide repeat-containing protein, putative [Perkinsus marinus ATCC 50983]|uniref:Pentatricopeptide repeat-containing protein, putative n=1 Tax=Perkinsus marinus (strain ATCC 50983 / TXsc) TaxID=423536 RepID=C5KM66_PERM5|nr:pentatricopeptide repeat-containing protein, putative [Perkinsus marinus ATCC 50983]EER14427.1 pentatricopeptide repeat-containing protein, putative [Perkinsus marinus ATCC 50983]|eukprot:XP_002782632.1 pentatricopeptide repeat-containing protein, putative [Perkinsus marinus ATCC 50983]
MVVRPVAGMPRDHRLFIQGDESMHLEDLGLPASSVFREDGVQKVRDLYRKKMGDKVPVSEWFWHKKRRQRKKEPGTLDWAGEWSEGRTFSETGPESKPKRSHEEEDPPGAFMGGIQDLVGKQSSKVDAKTREAVSPTRFARKYLGSSKSVDINAEAANIQQCMARKEGEPAGKPEYDKLEKERYGEKDGSAALGDDSGLTATDRKVITDVGTNIIGQLRAAAAKYAATGISPEMLLREGYCGSGGGIEHTKRTQELAAHEGSSFVKLLEAGQGCTENINLFIRSIGSRVATARGAKKEKLLAKALEIHDKMIEHGFETNEDTYVSLMIACYDEAELARKVYIKMREHLLAPSLKVYGALIKAHIRAHDITSAFALQRKMEDEGLKPGVEIYTMLIDGLVKAGRYEVAWEQFWDARSFKQIQPDSVMFTVMVKACRKKEECERAMGVFEDMKQSGQFPTDITYQELILCYSTDKYFAPRAFEIWNQMQAEDMPMTTPIARGLLQACATLGDVPRLQATVRAIRLAGIPFSTQMHGLCIRVFGAAMQLKGTTDFERVSHLRCAWHIVSAVRESNKKLTADILDEVTKVYAAGGFASHAIDMVQQYASFGVAPTVRTYETLLRMLGKGMGDNARFMALYTQMKEHFKAIEVKEVEKKKMMEAADNSLVGVEGIENNALVVPDDPDRCPSQMSEEMLRLALDVAMNSKSSRATLAVLDDMYSRGVMPLPYQAGRLAKVGRKVVQLHHMIGKLVAKNRQQMFDKVSRRKKLDELEIRQHELLLAKDGLTTLDATPLHEARERYWDYIDRKSGGKDPSLPYEQYRQMKKKGGDFYAKMRDKPQPNFIAEKFI